MDGVCFYPLTYIPCVKIKSVDSELGAYVSLLKKTRTAGLTVRTTAAGETEGDTLVTTGRERERVGRHPSNDIWRESESEVVVLHNYSHCSTHTVAGHGVSEVEDRTTG